MRQLCCATLLVAVVFPALAGQVPPTPAPTATEASPADLAEAGQPAAEPTIQALWLEQEIYYTHSGFTSYYTCDGLRDKVKYFLEQLGARDDLKVVTAGCMQVSGPEMFPRVRIRVATAVEATPERLAVLEQGRSRRELIARVNNDRSGGDDAMQQFAARTRRVEVKDTASGRIQAGDCEFVEHFADEVLPKLGLRVLSEGMRCTPKQVNRGSIKLVVEVLEPLPPPAEPSAASPL